MSPMPCVLFLSTCADLEKKSHMSDGYEVLRSSGLLRQLLLDHPPLVHAVNKIHQVEIRFRITENPPPSSPPSSPLSEL